MASDGATLASYAYTGAGEQVKRTTAGGTTLFVYDEAGQLLGQYDGAGNPLQQYIWLDTLPVGVIAGGAVYHVQPDHLGTPRTVIDPATDTAIWSWSILGEAFGTTIPNEDPDGDSVPFVFDLRFPGQRFDRFSGINQNYYREYEPRVGRYTTSDPIGLNAGWSTYEYVVSSPLKYIDADGLLKVFINSGGNAYFGIWGGSAESAVGFDLKGNICYVSTTCGVDVSIGLGAGLSVGVGYGSGDFCNSDTEIQQTRADLAVGGVGVGMTVDEDWSSGAAGRGMVGFAVGAAFETCRTITRCVNVFGR